MDTAISDNDNNKIHVWLIDDDEHYRQFVGDAFFQVNDRIFFQAFERCEEAMKQLESSSPPHVILLDISLPGGMSGLKGLEQFRREIPYAYIVMVTISEQDNDVYEAFCRGATGYLVKSSLPEKAIEAVYDAIEGRSFIDSHIAGKILKMADMSTDLRRQYQLTAAELKILELVKAGNSRKKIQNDLFIAESTLKYHLKNIYSKLQVHSLTEAITKTFHQK